MGRKGRDDVGQEWRGTGWKKEKGGEGKGGGGKGWTRERLGEEKAREEKGWGRKKDAGCPSKFQQQQNTEDSKVTSILVRQDQHRSDTAETVDQC